jgi:hypothetical protein
MVTSIASRIYTRLTDATSWKGGRGGARRRRRLPHAPATALLSQRLAGDGRAEQHRDRRGAGHHEPRERQRARALCRGPAGRAPGLAPRRGVPRPLTDEQMAALLTCTLETTPENAIPWSTRSVVAACGLSAATVQRVWHAFGLKPHQTESFKLSADPALPSSAASCRRSMLPFRASSSGAGLHRASPCRAQAVPRDQVSRPGPRQRGAPLRAYSQGARSGFVINFQIPLAK